MIPGYDVSFWQDNDYTPVKINFQVMKNYGKFVIVRQGQGLFTDEDFPDYWRDAKAAGMVRMAYHFFTWDESPEAQAEKFYNDLKDDPPDRFRWRGKWYRGYWGDAEWWGDVPPNALELYTRFHRKMRELVGDDIGIYTSPAFWKQYGSTDIFWMGVPLWLAHWGVDTPVPPAPWKDVCIWQWGTPAIGEQVGVESKEVDANWFMGSEFDLGLKEQPPMANKYQTYAKVLYIQGSSFVTTIPSEIDAVFVQATIGEAFAPRLAEQIQIVKDSGKPLLFFCEAWMDLYTEWATLPWNNENDTQLKIIKQAMKIAAAKGCPVKGIMIDCSMSTWREDPTKAITDVNLSRTAEYLLEIVAKYCGVPTWLYMNKTPFTFWKGSPHLSALLDRRSISFYGKPLAGLDNGVPAADSVIFDGTDKSLLAYYPTSDWKFWFYDYKLGAYPGIYRGTKAGLYAAIKVTEDPNTPPVDPPIDPPTPEPTPTLEEVKNKFGELLVLLKQYFKE